MKDLITLLVNPIFRSGVFSWIFCQVIKTIIGLYRNRAYKPKEMILNLFWTTGGMPSSHSAAVCSITTAIGIELGISEPLFIVSLFSSFIVIRDALGVRRAAGYQAIAINQVLTELNKRFNIKIKPVKEIHGHKYSEVFVGMILGFFLAVAFCIL